MNVKVKTFISKIIEFSRKFTIKILSNNKDKKMIKKHKNWRELSKDEKKYINHNKNFLKIMKNVYYDWDNCTKEYFLSDYCYQTQVLLRLNVINSKRIYFTDKNYQPKFLEYFETPKVIVRRIDGDYYDENYEYISFENAIMLLNSYSKAAFKISVGSGHGKGVELVNKNDYRKKLDQFGNNFVVQDIIKQNDFFRQYNESSVNVVRVTSLYLDGNVYILSAILRVGAPGSFCDHKGFSGNNPRIVALDEKGNLYGNAIDPDEGFIYKDLFGKKIEGKIPKYDEIIEKVKKEHKKFTHHRIIGWDITIDNRENILCIEYNIIPGVTQSQMVCGPIFKQKSANGTPLLDEIMKKETVVSYIW